MQKKKPPTKIGNGEIRETKNRFVNAKLETERPMEIERKFLGEQHKRSQKRQFQNDVLAVEIRSTTSNILDYHRENFSPSRVQTVETAKIQKMKL